MYSILYRAATVVFNPRLLMKSTGYKVIEGNPISKGNVANEEA